MTDDPVNGAPAHGAPEDGLISDRYRLGELLGTGGSASVFAAVDALSGDQVALKILHPHLSRSEQAREAFFAEARAAQPLRHPNIVAVLGVGVHDAGGEPLAWIALELASGTTLAEQVEVHGALGVAASLTVAEGVLNALEAAHSIGLMHRDVSPANIMVALDPTGFVRVGEVRLVDFGLADAAGRPVLGTDILRTSTASSSQDAAQPADPELGVIGSANYMSPEQATGSGVDERGDLYQVGAVLHYALTGRPPFVRGSTAAVMRAHVRSPPPVPSVLHAGIPRSVDRLVVKALLKDPANRFGSAAAMRAAVSEIRKAETDSNPARTRRLPSATPPPNRTVANEPSSRTAPAAPIGSVRRGGRGAAVWLAAILTVTVIAVAWVLASGSSPSSSVAIESSAAAPAIETPSGASPTAATPTQTVPPAPPAIVQIAVPDLRALTLADARSALESTGLRVGIVTPQASPLAGDTVLSSAPGPGSSVSADSAVDIVVASGSNTVPHLTGSFQSEAIAAIQDAGFAVVVTSRPDARVRAGTVIGTDPSDGTALRLGSSVTIFLSTGPSPTPSPTPTPTQSSTPAPTPSVTPKP
jgi:serine/threonine protein kinase